VGYDCTYQEGRRRDAERERESLKGCTAWKMHDNRIYVFFFGFNAVFYLRGVFAGTRKLTYIPESPETIAPTTASSSHLQPARIPGAVREHTVCRLGGGGVLRFCKSH
jgi:hypothetical protein